jgi:hypothetical protein
MTPVQRLADYVRSRFDTTVVFDNLVENLLSKEKQHMLSFHKWMKENDTSKNAEIYFHYSDGDMLEEYLKSKYEKNI